MTDNEITERIIGCAIRVHRELGPGLLESSYQAALFFELVDSGIQVEKEVPVPMVYRNVRLDCGFRIDLLVEQRIVVEVKSIECFNSIHMAQVITYLKLAKCRLGILLNFNVTLMKHGIKRIAN